MPSSLSRCRELLVDGIAEQMCTIFSCINTEPKKELPEATISFDLSIQVKNLAVRIVHPGGRVELYCDVILASQLMQRHPGMCIARPDVFKHPYESVLSADDKLLPGHKYYLIPNTTVRKLKRKHSAKKKVKFARVEESILDSKEFSDLSGDFSNESVCSAKDFYISGYSSSRYSPKKEKKPFVPPIRKPRAWREFEWEPSLTSIQEASP